MAIGKGVVVRLKSGGPKMTVVDISEYQLYNGNQALCSWFLPDGKPMEKLFPPESLDEILGDEK